MRNNDHDLLVLSLLAAKPDQEHYGWAIKRRLKEHYDIDTRNVYKVLHKLEAKGFVKSRLGPQDDSYAGPPRKYYQLTDSGKKRHRALCKEAGTGMRRLCDCVNKGRAGSDGRHVLLESIKEPGCYVSHWDGHLFRITEDAIKPDGGPLVTLVSRSPLYVTKSSENPYLALQEAQRLASNHDLFVNF